MGYGSTLLKKFRQSILLTLNYKSIWNKICSPANALFIFFSFFKLKTQLGYSKDVSWFLRSHSWSLGLIIYTHTFQGGGLLPRILLIQAIHPPFLSLSLSLTISSTSILLIDSGEGFLTFLFIKIPNPETSCLH